MLSLIFNSVDSNVSLAFAEATGIVVRGGLFISSSRRRLSLSSLSNSVMTPTLSGLSFADECFPAIFKGGIDAVTLNFFEFWIWDGSDRSKFSSSV